MRGVLALILLAGCGDPLADATLSVELSIESITPQRLRLDGAEIVTVLGRNFSSELKATFGGEPIDIAVRDDRQLFFESPARPPGEYLFRLEGPRGAAAEAPVRYSARTVLFAEEHVILDVPAEKLWTADFHGAGVQEMVIFTGTELLWAEARAGTWITHPILEDLQRAELVVVDLDGDGRDELAADILHGAGGGYRQRFYLMTMKDGMLQAERVPWNHDDFCLASGAAGDFDGDGDRELGLFLTRYLEQNGTLTLSERLVLLDHGLNQTFQLNYFNARRSADFADFDGDGLQDVALQERPRVDVAFGPDTAGIDQTWTGTTTSELFAVDVDGDGLVDLLSADGVHMFNTGNRTFETRQREPLCQQGFARGLVVDDRVPSPGDGDLTTTLVSCGEDLVSWRWVGQTSLLGAVYPGRATAGWTGGNFDPDSGIDLVYSTPRGLVLGSGGLGLYEGYFTTFPSKDLVPPVCELCEGSRPTRPALTALPEGFAAGSGVTLEVHDDGPHRSLQLPTADGGAITGLDACDLNGDGLADLIVMVEVSGQTEIHTVTDDGTDLRATASTIFEERIGAVFGGDFDGDGRCEVLVQPETYIDFDVSPPDIIVPQEMYVWSPTTDGRTSLPYLSKGIQVFDEEGDGDDDISGVFGPVEIGDDEIQGVLLRAGTDLRFTMEGRYTLAIRDDSGQLRHLDDLLIDGDTTYGLERHVAGAGLLLTTIVDGTTTDALPLRVDQTRRRLAWAELDGDGLPDLLVIALDGTEVLPILSRPEGWMPLDPFPLAELHLGEAFPAVAVLDLDRDGLDDLLFTTVQNPAKAYFVRNDSR